MFSPFSLLICSCIAYGSCNNQNLANPLWNIIQSRNPSAFVLGGDATYAGKCESNINDNDSHFDKDYRHAMD